MTEPAIEVVCERCGGYGATVYPASEQGEATQQPCDDCLGTGRVFARVWSQWQPDPEVLEWLASVKQLGEPR